MNALKDRLRRRKPSSPHSGTSVDSPRRSRRLKAAGSGKEQLPIYSPSSHPKSQLPASALVQSSSSASTAPHSPHVRAGPETNRRQLSWSHAPDEATSPTTRAEDAQDARFTFFTFPPELRNMIYEYSLQYPDSRQLYSSYYLHKQLELDAGRSKRHPTSPTPWAPRIRPQTILLLNKRITNECLPMLKSRTLVIDRLPPPRALHEKERVAIKACSTRNHDDFHHFMQLSDFITPRTLQSIPHIEINVGLCEGPLSSGWAWRPVIEELLHILKQKNVCTKLRLLLRLCNTHEDRIAWQSDQQHVSWIEKKMEKFANDNPNVFARHEVLLDVWNIVAHEAKFVSSSSYPQYKRVDEEGKEILVNEYGLKLPKMPAKPNRWYPDKEMFPGSVMQFTKAVTSLRYADFSSD